MVQKLKHAAPTQLSLTRPTCSLAAFWHAESPCASEILIKTQKWVCTERGFWSYSANMHNMLVLAAVE